MAFPESRLVSSDEIKAAITEFARGFNHNYYHPLHLAILKGDWESARIFFEGDPNAVTAKITTVARTALHVAAIAGQWKLVEKLVQEMPVEALAEVDLMGCTALHYVALGGNTTAAKALVTRNPSLTQIPDFEGFSPLAYAITSTSKELLWYLALVTTDERPACPFSGPSASRLVALLTAAGFHDITLFILQRYPNLATMVDSNGSVIFNVLSKMPSDFQSGSKLGILGRFIYHFVPVELDHVQPRTELKDLHASSKGFIWKTIEKLVPGIKLVIDTKLRHKSAEILVEHVCSQASITNNSLFWQSFISAEILRNTISSGIVEILRICFQFFPDLIWTKMPNEGYIMQVAIKNRQEKVFSLLSKMPIGKLLVLVVDESQNTTSHHAARLSSSPRLALVSGPAFQMQKELRWFKEVEKFDHPLHKQVKNQEGKTAWQLFKDEHKDLLEKGERWMKDTSNSSMLVAALIATVAFAATITVPGGNDQTKGTPTFLSDKTFLVFAVSDALALFSSVASIFMFLSILTAYYAEEDFLKRLPRNMILALASLFISIATILIAFGAALCLLLGERLKWMPIPVTIVASLPLALFAVLQVPLFVRMIVSTYGRGICHPQDLW
ncbi:hypothetical protein QN277_018473 [Acacia crassicarpa]|uniref:PGG domain-containing protein n=1 Tax=Acacia crassicarpa TaxID=499986 RepID=A0AAE1MUR9_9FABA|nr:hypothetical protein QN277_018473 [Acacia crassicarpa]